MVHISSSLISLNIVKRRIPRMYGKYIVYFNVIRLACARFLEPSRDAYETVPRTWIKSAGVCHLLTKAFIRQARNVQLVLNARDLTMKEISGFCCDVEEFFELVKFCTAQVGSRLLFYEPHISCFLY
jgi:hypothetical protein